MPLHLRNHHSLSKNSGGRGIGRQMVNVSIDKSGRPCDGVFPLLTPFSPWFLPSILFFSLALLTRHCTGRQWTTVLPTLLLQQINNHKSVSKWGLMADLWFKSRGPIKPAPKGDLRLQGNHPTPINSEEPKSTLWALLHGNWLHIISPWAGMPLEVTAQRTLTPWHQGFLPIQILGKWLIVLGFVSLAKITS